MKQAGSRVDLRTIDWNWFQNFVAQGLAGESRDAFQIFREALTSRRSSAKGIFPPAKDLTSVEVPA